MGNLYLVDFGEEEERARLRVEREAERLRVRQRYVERLITHAGLDGSTADRVMAVLCDHVADDGSRCLCSCHPQLSSQHGDGSDCPCTWDRERRVASRRAWLDDLRNSEWAKAVREQHEAEEREICTWLSGQVDVTAKRTSS